MSTYTIQSTNLYTFGYTPESKGTAETAGRIPPITLDFHFAVDESDKWHQELPGC